MRVERVNLLEGGLALVDAVPEKSQVPVAWPFFWKKLLTA